MANKNFEVKHGLSVGGTERITAAGAGSFTDLALSGDLNITGDVNSVSVTDLDVTDKTITLGKGQTESNSGSSGIIIDGSSASMLWDESNDEFDFNKGVNITGTLSISGDGSNAVTFAESGAGLMTIAAADDIILDAGSDIIFDADGADIRYKDAGTEFLRLNNGTTGPVILSPVSDKDLVFKGNDSGSEFIALTLDMSEAGAAIFNNKITLGDGHQIGNDSTDNLVLNSSSGENIVLASAGNHFFNTGASSLTSQGTTRMIINSSGNVGIGTASPDALLRLDQDANSVAFKVTGGGSGVNIAEFVRDVGATASINLNASGGKPQIQFVDSNTFAMGVNSNTFEIADNTALGTNSRFVILNTGFVGIGETTPTSKLHISGSNSTGGIFVEDSSNSGVSPVIKVQGKRSDANKSQSFSGGISLESLYTGGLAPSTKHTGTIYFGTNHTDGTAANMAYGASISGYMTGNANSITDMPMGITFYTGSTGRALGTSNVTYGDERMRISGNGDVMLGNTVVNPASGFSNQKGFGYDFSHGTTEVAVDSDTTCLVLGRNHGNNGVMQTFRKQSTSFAEIGIEGGDSLYIQAGTTSGSGILLHGTGAKVLPARQGTSIDATIDLGQASRRWKKLWCQKIDATDANGNTSVGYESHNVLGASGNSGDANTAIGYQANEKLTTGSNNVAAGYRAGMNVTNGNYNTALGVFSMYTNQGGSRNTALGFQALYTATGNDHNTAVGNRALVTAGNNGSCTAVGSQALENATTGGHYNTAIGAEAGIACTTGVSNVFVGRKAGYDATDANNNVFIGQSTQNDNAGTSNQVVIGNTARSQGSGKFTVGTSSSTYSHLTIGGTSWSGSSDERLKKEITDSTAGLSFINDLRPITFKWKTKGEVDSSLPHYEEGSNEPVIGNSDSSVLTKHGFIAQEVKTAIDNHTAVKDGSEIWEENRDGIQSFSPTALIPMLVKAIQELEARVKELEG